MKCIKCQECVEQCMGIFSFKPHTNLIRLSTIIPAILLMKELRIRFYNLPQDTQKWGTPVRLGVYVIGAFMMPW